MFLESSCRRALEGFHFYNSCVTERLWEKGVLLKRRACVWSGGMCIRRLYLVGMLCPGSMFIVMLKQECQRCVMKACKAAAVLFHLFSSGFTFIIYIYNLWLMKLQLSSKTKWAARLPSKDAFTQCAFLSSKPARRSAADWNWMLRPGDAF